MDHRLYFDSTHELLALGFKIAFEQVELLRDHHRISVPAFLGLWTTVEPAH